MMLPIFKSSGFIQKVIASQIKYYKHDGLLFIITTYLAITNSGMVFGKSTSYQDLQAAIITNKITREFIIKTSNFSIFFSLFLANSKGKDKFLSLFQYLFEFICLCGKHSNIVENAALYKQHKLIDMVVYYNLKESISSARKVFRLFRFFDQIKGLVKLLKTNKPFMFKAISVFTYGCSILYYLSDNILWFLSILVKSSVLDKAQSKRWKERKNFSSFSRVIAYTMILIYEILEQKKEIEEHEIFIQDKINEENERQKCDQLFEDRQFIELIDGRRKLRFLYLEVFLSIFRFLMLTKSLRLRGHQYLDPIFVGVCGLASSILGFLKALCEKKIVINLENKNNTSKYLHQSTQQNIVSIKRFKRADSVMTSRFW